jgi:hypothetical protein
MHQLSGRRLSVVALAQSGGQEGETSKSWIRALMTALAPGPFAVRARGWVRNLATDAVMGHERRPAAPGL